MVTGPASLDEYDMEPNTGRDFYARIGRVVARTALMEWWLFHLACTLDRATPQDRMSQKFGDQLMNVCRSHLPDLPDELRGELSRLLDQIGDARQQRNAVVQSVWPVPGEPNGYGHRPKPKALRASPVDWIADAYFPPERLDELAAEVEQHVVGLMKIRQQCESALANRR
jgi:hypothetical protein